MRKEITVSTVVDLLADRDTVSTSFLQRALRLGYGYAASIVDYLEEQGAVYQEPGDPRAKLDHEKLEALRQSSDTIVPRR